MKRPFEGSQGPLRAVQLMMILKIRSILLLSAIALFQCSKHSTSFIVGTTYLKLFTIKVAPIATYGIQLIWNHLTYTNFKRLEGVKTAYLKRMLCVSKYTPNRITYILADTTFFIEDLMAAHNLVPTLQSTRFLEDRRQKSRTVDQGPLNAPAMRSSE